MPAWLIISRSGRRDRSDRFRPQKATGSSGAGSSSIQQTSSSCQQTAASSVARSGNVPARLAGPPGRRRRSDRATAWLASMSDQPALDAGRGLPSRARVRSKCSRAWGISPSWTWASASSRCQRARKGSGASRRRAALSTVWVSRNQPRCR